MMDEQEVRELENPENWDFEKAERHKGVKKPRAVVSVAFSREDFEKVEEQSEKLRLTLSKFIRDAALEKVNMLALRSTLSTDTKWFITIVNETRRTNFVWQTSNIRMPSMEDTGTTSTEGREPQMLSLKENG